MLPIAVRRYVNLPGPTAGAVSPCPEDQTVSWTSSRRRNTACLGSRDECRRSGRTRQRRQRLRLGEPRQRPRRPRPGRGDPRPGRPARSTARTSAGSSHSTSATSQAAGTQLYYNGVTASTNSNTLKDMEANWVTVGGYPGPHVPRRRHPAGSERPGRDDERQLDRHRHRRDARPVRRQVTKSSSRSIRATSWRSRTSRSRRRRRSRCRRRARSLSVGLDQGRRSNQPSLGARSTLSTLRRYPRSPTIPIVDRDPHRTPSRSRTTPNPVTPSLGSGTTVTLSNMTTVGAATGCLHALDPGPGRQPVSHDEVEPVGAQGRHGQLATSRITSTSSIEIARQRRRHGHLHAQPEARRVRPTAPTVNLSLDGPLPTGIGATSFSPSAVTPRTAPARTPL